MNTLPLTVLAHEGPQARAYLACMGRAGVRPRNIVLIVQSHHPATGKAVGRWLPPRPRIWYAERVQECANNYWPRRITASHPGLVECIVRGMAGICDDPVGSLREISGRFRYEDYAENVERAFVRDLADEVLGEVLARLEPGAVLFTGGGLLPSRILETPGLRFIHVHPGYLPYVRGADGLLWSVLVRGCPGLSCFYMVAGIDRGDVIVAEDYPPLRFDLPNKIKPDEQTLYRALFSFCDPLLRAEFFVRRIASTAEDLASLPASRQKPRDGIMYHFMHSSLRRVALARLFPNVSDKGMRSAKRWASAERSSSTGSADVFAHCG